MKNVWLEQLYENDFKFLNKYPYDYNYTAYVFNVYGETANYLMNRYDLIYEDVFVICLLHENVNLDTIFIGSCKENGCKQECFEPEDINDIVRISNLLHPFIKEKNLV